MKSTLIASVLAGMATAGSITSNYGVTKDVDINIKTEAYPSANLNSLYSSSGSTVTTNQNVFGVIQQASSDASFTASRSINSLFSRLPSSIELDQLILSSDSVAILKTIQTVATDDSIPCDQRIAYLLELLGRIRSAIAKKQFSADQLVVIVNGAKAEITRLQASIDGLKQNITDLWLDELRDKLSDAIISLEDVYRQFNYVDFQIGPNEAKVAGYEKEIEILRKKAEEERNRITNDRLKLSATISTIQSLEAQLADHKSRKAALEFSIQKSEKIIADDEAQIAQATANIKDLEAQIKKLRDQADALRSKSNTLEIQVERLRTDISVAQAKEANYNEQINVLNDRIVVERKKLVSDDLDKLQRMIGTLKRLAPST